MDFSTLIWIYRDQLPGLLQDRQKAGVQGAAAPWRSARCPRTLLISLPPQAAIRYFATALDQLLATRFLVPAATHTLVPYTGRLF